MTKENFKTLAKKVSEKLDKMGIKYDGCGCGNDLHLSFTNEDETINFSIYFEDENDNYYTLDICKLECYEEDTYYNKAGDIKNEIELFTKIYKSLSGLNKIKKYI